MELFPYMNCTLFSKTWLVWLVWPCITV